MVTVYLAHPYADQALGLEIQKEIEALGIEVINPFIRKEQETYRKVIHSGNEFSFEQCQEIVETDLEKIDRSDGIVALFTEKLSVGTSMETFYTSHECDKPVFSYYALMERHAKERGFGFVHPWIKYLTSVSMTREELYGKLKAWVEKGTYVRGTTNVEPPTELKWETIQK